MTKPNFVNNLELTDSATKGNQIAKQLIIKNRRPTYEITLRHALAMNGMQAAIELAISLDYSEQEAIEFVKHIQRTKPNSIATPYRED